MKTVVLAMLAPAAFVQAQWWGGAPDCAHDCFSSYWSSASAWPTPSEYCGATQGAEVSSCINTACSATPTATVSYSSLSSSLCSRWSSCSSAGSTGVYTVTAPTGAAGGPWGNYGGSKTWTGGVYTVTGCEWEGSPWAGGPGGWGNGGYGPGGYGPAGGPWGAWGHGWSWTTKTATVTATLTSTNDNRASTTTSTGLATLALAASGDFTSTSTLHGAEATGAAAAPDAAAVKVMGAVLGGVVAVAGLL